MSMPVGMVSIRSLRIPDGANGLGPVSIARNPPGDTQEMKWNTVHAPSEH